MRVGPPTQQRRDGGAVIWNYEAAGVCRLNLVLQRERGGQKVVHAQARLAPGVGEAIRRPSLCLASSCRAS